jgi:hypothetical protein
MNGNKVETLFSLQDRSERRIGKLIWRSYIPGELGNRVMYE